MYFPDNTIVNWVISGLTNGFKIGIQPDKHIDSSTKNLPTDTTKKDSISNWLYRGLSQGFVTGPFTEAPYDDAIISPMGAVVQKNKVRPIFHLSAPKKTKTSVNDALYASVKTVSYIKLAEVASWIHSLGVNSYVWVADMEDAYMHVQVHPSDWKYLGVRWLGLYFFLTCLPFGLSSSCWIYESLADIFIRLLCFICPTLFLGLVHHYLDDFFGGFATYAGAYTQYTVFILLCDYFRFTLKRSKLSPPNTIQQILGWLYNTSTQMLYLPERKVKELRRLIDIYLTAAINKRPLSQKFYQSLFGKLRWACTAIPQSRVFLITLHHLSFGKYWSYNNTRIPSQQSAEDLTVFKDTFLTSLQICRPFTAFFVPPISREVITVDGCTSYGIGGWFSKGHYYSLSLPKKVIKKIKKYNRPDIQYLELLAIIVALKLWAPLLRGQHIDIFGDNIPVEFHVNKLSTPAHRGDLIILLKELAKFVIPNNITLTIKRVSTYNNTISDKLSRGDIMGAIKHMECSSKSDKAPIKYVNKLLKSYINPDEYLLATHCHSFASDFDDLFNYKPKK